MWVDVDGGRLFVEQTGEGSALVLVHGWPLDHRVFEPQRKYLSRCFQVITFDRRGFGRSEAPADLSLELDDLERIRTSLSLDRVHLLGMSQGGRIALRFAVTRPGRLRSLILQSAVVDGLDLASTEAERIPLEEYARLARAGRVDIVRQRWTDHPMMAIDDRYPSARKQLSRILSAYTGADLLRSSGSQYAFPVKVVDELPRLTVPTLLLTGALETDARRAHARKLLELVPDIREVEFHHSGHLCNLTEPDLYNRCVDEFCNDVDRKLLASGSGGLD